MNKKSFSTSNSIQSIQDLSPGLLIHVLTPLNSNYYVYTLGDIKTNGIQFRFINDNDLYHPIFNSDKIYVIGYVKCQSWHYFLKSGGKIVILNEDYEIKLNNETNKFDLINSENTVICSDLTPATTLNQYLYNV